MLKALNHRLSGRTSASPDPEKTDPHSTMEHSIVLSLYSAEANRISHERHACWQCTEARQDTISAAKSVKPKVASGLPPIFVIYWLWYYLDCFIILGISAGDQQNGIQHADDAGHS
ncbi:MAG: hypothetical protein ACI4O7_13065 [Aristaeellaceae bacterium]